MTENKNRVVVTGMGMITSIGSSVEECWKNALNSVSGIKETHTVDTKDCYANLASEVPSDLKDVKTDGYVDRVTKLALHATKEAMEDAGLKDFHNDTRVSVIVGSCVGGVKSIEDYYTNGKDVKNIAQMPICAIGSQVAGYVHAGGTVTDVGNACAAGTISISYAADLIRAGKADIVLAGGSDAFASVPFAGFMALHALSSDPCSPFNHCQGITLGEGAGIVVVESYEHALKRKAKMYCEVLGAGVSSDAHHITAPDPTGFGQMNAISWAIEHSGIQAKDIGYINAHGTGTKKNDDAEFLSLHTIFDPVTDNLSVSSTKAMVGHCLGAAGAIESIFAIKALDDNMVPPTLGYSDEDLQVLKERGGKIDFVPNKAHSKKLDYTMDNSFAFGGNNASIVFSKHEGDVKLPEKVKVAITGFGLVTPLGNGFDTYLNNLAKDKRISETSAKSAVTPEDYASLGILRSFFRKLDVVSSYEVVSGGLALKNSNIEVSEENQTDIGIVVGTSEGALGMGCVFEEDIAAKGNAHGSAFHFPNTVYNAAGGYLSIASGIKGYNVTITSGIQSGLQALCYAYNVIEKGYDDVVLSSGVDENIPVSDELYRRSNLIASKVPALGEEADGFALSDGGVTLVAEEEKHAKQRGAKIYSYVLGYGMTHEDVKVGTLKGSSFGLDRAIEEALKDAGITKDEISFAVGFADGLKEVDEVEEESLRRVFGEKLASLPILSVKARYGEARAATSAMGALEASLLLSGTVKEDGDAYLYQNGKKEKTVIKSENSQYALVLSFGFGGSYTAVILSSK